MRNNAFKEHLMSRIKVNKILLYDCEATCFDDSQKTKNEGELIEIAIVPLDLDRMELREDLFYSSLVKPLKSEISRYCTDLTGITQEQINERGKSFNVVALEIREKYQQRVANGSYGNYDPWLIERTSRAHNVKNPFEKTHYNIKNMYSIFSGAKKEMGLLAALSDSKKTFKGCQHTALDDTLNMGRLILPYFKMLKEMRESIKNG